MFLAPSPPKKAFLRSCRLGSESAPGAPCPLHGVAVAPCDDGDGSGARSLCRKPPVVSKRMPAPWALRAWSWAKRRCASSDPAKRSTLSVGKGPASGAEGTTALRAWALRIVSGTTGAGGAPLGSGRAGPVFDGDWNARPTASITAPSRHAIRIMSGPVRRVRAVRRRSPRRGSSGGSLGACGSVETAAAAPKSEAAGITAPPSRESALCAAACRRPLGQCAQSRGLAARRAVPRRRPAGR